MSRPLSVRVVSLALALWLPLFMSGAEWAVRCPAHGGYAASPHGTAGQTHLADHDHGNDQSAPANHGSGHNCSCPGPGCCAAAVAVIPTVTLPLARVVAVHEARAVSTLDLLASDRAYLLPFATAPPAVVLAPAASHVA